MIDVQPGGLGIESGLLLGAELPTALVAQDLHHAADFHIVAQLVGEPPVCALHLVAFAVLCCASREGGVLCLVVLIHFPAVFASPIKCTEERDLARWA